MVTYQYVQDFFNTLDGFRNVEKSLNGTEGQYVDKFFRCDENLGFV